MGYNFLFLFNVIYLVNITISISQGTYEYTLPNQPIFESSHTNSAFTLGNQCTYPQRIQPPPYQGYPAGPVVPAPSVS